MDDSTPAPARISSIPEHGIAVVERSTGVSQHVLRAWERRYGVINPARGDTGQRLYSEDDIERLRLVRIVAAGGRRIGQVIGLPIEELYQLARRDARESVTGQRAPSSPIASRDAAEHLNACLDAVREMQAATTFNVLMRAAVALGPRGFIEGVAVPLLQFVGDGWAAGLLRPANELSLSYALRRVLTWVLDALPAPMGAPTVVFATLPGQRHEFGAMFAAIIAASRQWTVSYLGGDLPLDEIAYAASVAKADVVAVSVVGSPETKLLRRDLEQLRTALPSGIPLVVGGSNATTHSHALEKTGALILSDLGAWESWLDATAAALALRKPASLTPDTGVSRWR